MQKSNVANLIGPVLSQGKEWVVIEPEPGLEQGELRITILELLEYEHLIDITVARLPMCFMDVAFNHLDNKPAPEKRKSQECVRCKFNFFCNGFYPEMEEYVKAIPDIPIEVVIEVTDKCNQACSFCFNKFEYRLDARNARKEMNGEEVKCVLKKVKEMGVKIVRFSGGEPLLRKDIFNLIEFAKDLGLKVWLNTNGTLVAEIAKLIGLVENVLIPIHGFDEKTDEAETRLKGSFGLKLKAIELLNPHCLVRCGVVLTKQNAANIERFYLLAGQHGIRIMEFYRPIELGRHDYLKKAISNIASLNKKHNRNFRIANAIPYCFNSQVARVAQGGVYDDGATRIVVDSRGMLKPSYYLVVPMGDALQTPLWDAWNSEEWLALRELRRMPIQCTKCIHRHTCRGGSRALAKLNSGDIAGKDPLMKRPVLR